MQVDETQAFWALPTSSVQRTDYEHLDHEPLAVLLNAMPSEEPLVQARARACSRLHAASAPHAT